MLKNGYINYFDWVIFNSYVSLPEGIDYKTTSETITYGHHHILEMVLYVTTISSLSWVVNMTWFCWPRWCPSEANRDMLGFT